MRLPAASDARVVFTSLRRGGAFASKIPINSPACLSQPGSELDMDAAEALPADLGVSSEAAALSLDVDRSQRGKRRSSELDVSCRITQALGPAGLKIYSNALRMGHR